MAASNQRGQKLALLVGKYTATEDFSITVSGTFFKTRKKLKKAAATAYFRGNKGGMVNIFNPQGHN